MSRADSPGAHRRVEHAATWAARLADGEVPAAQQSEFESWLAEAPANGAALEEITGAWDAVERYAAAEPMMALREAALASARRSAQAGKHRPMLRWRGAGIAAALVLTVATAVAGAWVWMQPSAYVTGVGERRIVALADGSKLSLDGDSRVEVRYSGKERRLWLRKGRAQFEVAKNPLRPFSVEAGSDVIVATGTAFSVELLQRQVRVVLYEGHVALLERGSGGGAKPILTPQLASADRLLTPGREIILNPLSALRAGGPEIAVHASPVAAVAAADPVRSLAWEEGQLAFQDEPLGVVVERMNRYADKPLTIADAGARAARISGVFRAGDTEALIEGLAAGFDIRARTGSGSVTLYKPAT